tara:strand:- start:93 stop:1193 length:1101 start_codon:yes stop_codon:yes gene_type:complete
MNKISKGTLNYQDYIFLNNKKIICSKKKIPKNSFQPASIDLRLGCFAYKIKASFLAINEKIEDKIINLNLKPINISNGKIFKKNNTYLVEIQEYLNLSKNLSGKCNPKSSTGRLDIFCRIITDFNSEYELIKKGYKGKLYLEITSKTFNINFTAGDKLNQLRLRNYKTKYINDNKLKKLDKISSFLFNKNNFYQKPLIKNGIRVKADISSDKSIIAYRAKKTSKILKFNKINKYKPIDFWDEIKISNKKSIIIEPNKFYLIKSKDKIQIPYNLAAEMIPYDTDIGEFRVHYAGFFDPGFGIGFNGSHAVLEIKTYEVPFIIEDGQNVARLIFEKLSNTPKKTYGNRIKSNYQNQDLALSKHFRILE